MNDQSHSQLTLADFMKRHATAIFTRVKNRLYDSADAADEGVDYMELEHEEEQLAIQIDYIDGSW